MSSLVDPYLQAGELWKCPRCNAIIDLDVEHSRCPHLTMADMKVLRFLKEKERQADKQYLNRQSQGLNTDKTDER